MHPGRAESNLAKSGITVPLEVAHGARPKSTISAAARYRLCSGYLAGKIKNLCGLNNLWRGSEPFGNIQVRQHKAPLGARALRGVERCVYKPRIAHDISRTRGKNKNPWAVGYPRKSVSVFVLLFIFANIVNLCG